jgi:predicted dehydrogenase
LQRLVAEKKLFNAVSYNYRAHPGVVSMKAAIDSGRFGAPLQLYSIMGQNFPTYRPAYRTIYFADRKQGGGAIQDAITHTFNHAEWLVGPITRIMVDADHLALEGVTVEDTVHAVARHGKVMASYALNMYQQPNDSHLTIVCEKGTVRFSLQEKRWRYMLDVDGTWVDEIHEMAERDTWYIHNANAILDGLEGKRPAPCTLDEGLQTLRVNLAALRSMETQTWQAIGEH